MRCFTDEQVEQAARAGVVALNPRSRAHLGRCRACADRYQQALADARIVADLRELRQSRSTIPPVFDETERHP